MYQITYENKRCVFHINSAVDKIEFDINDLNTILKIKINDIFSELVYLNDLPVYLNLTTNDGLPETYEITR